MELIKKKEPTARVVVKRREENKMNKKIALLISEIVENSPFSEDYSCCVIPQKGEGFWKVVLHFKRRNTSDAESLLRLIPLLGRVNGEELWINDDGWRVDVE